MTNDQPQGGMLLPPSPDKCQECAVDHPPEEPHNKQSLYYQTKFRGDHGRWPTWRDAVAHCAPEVQEFWEAELRNLGAWDGWEGPIPPAPDVLPTPGFVGTVTKIKAEDGGGDR